VYPIRLDGSEDSCLTFTEIAASTRSSSPRSDAAPNLLEASRCMDELRASRRREIASSSAGNPLQQPALQN
jgi:hypothetical protein